MDRVTLKPNKYLIETLGPLLVIAPDISDKLRRQILERNDYTCQVCGAGAGEESLCEPSKSTSSLLKNFGVGSTSVSR
jgi:hypothetical protein